MPHVFTSHDCELILSGYTRCNYQEGSIPVAIISLMSSFFNLWQQYRLTAEQLKELNHISTEKALSIAFTNVAIENIPFQLVITAKVIAESTDVEMILDYVRPKGIEFIGGYFGCCLRGFEYRRLYYSRSVMYGQDGYLTDFDTIPLSECNVLSDLQFSVYFDVQQIKYTETAELCDFDNLSPLKGYGGCQLVIEGDELCKLRPLFFIDANAGGNWTLRLSLDEWSGNDEIKLHPAHSFLPLSVWGFQLKLKGRCIITYKRNPTKYKLREKAGKTRLCGFEDTNHYSQGVVSSGFGTGIRFDEISDISSITMDIEWRIISILTRDTDLDSDDDVQDFDDIEAEDFGISLHCTEK